MRRQSRWDRYLESCRAARGLGVAEVTFELSRHHLPMKTESMWALRVGPDLFQLRNSPFWVEGVSFLDTIRAELRAGEWFFVEAVARSGHSTFRVRRTQRSLRWPWSLAFAPLKRLGCCIEGATPRWAAVDVPPTADIQEVLAELQAGEAEGRWRFEEGHYGHPRA